MSVTVSAVAERVGGRVDPAGDGGIEVTSIGHDSRSVEAGSLFCCVRGARFDGHAFASQAVADGAACLLVEHPVDVVGPVILVPDVRRAMGPAAALVHGDPSNELDVVGVTGTNGKTTSVHLLAAVCDQADRAVDTLGTLTGARTTPEAPELQAWLADARERHVRVVAMEVSSHALDMHRVDGTRFRVAVFTNLGHDHLDHHHDLESYFLAKARLFDESFCDVAIVNVDDPSGRRLADEIERRGGIELRQFGIGDALNLQAGGAASTFSWRGHPISLNLAGEHNVRNALGVALAAEALGIAPDVIAAGLSAVEPPRGRFEVVDIGRGFTVAVDYAHTPDALEAALRAARQVVGPESEHRVILVFGCGGDRDQAKRPLMGAVASDAADLVVVTSDNPRSEDPKAIIDAIVSGMDGADDGGVVVEADRAKAIALALDRAVDGDVVLIAGKGHETHQIIGDQVVDFDDRLVALAHVAAGGHGRNPGRATP